MPYYWDVCTHFDKNGGAHTYIHLKKDGRCLGIELPREIDCEKVEGKKFDTLDEALKFVGLSPSNISVQEVKS